MSDYMDGHLTAFACGLPTEPRKAQRQAMLSIREYRPLDDGGWAAERVETARVPVFVWPMPTQDGCFIVEHQDGTVHTVRPDVLTFLGSKELFDQCDWSKE